MGTPFAVGNSILVTTTTVGTGTYQIGTAVNGFRGFAEAGIPTGARVMIVVQDDPAERTEWEELESVYTAGSPGTLSRATIKGGSNGTSAVNWGAGTKYIFCTVLADRTPVYDTSGDLQVPGGLRIGTTLVAPGSGGFGNLVGASFLGTGALYVSSVAAPPLNANVASTSGGAAVVFTTYGAVVGTISLSPTTTSYNTSSDKRLKEELGPVDPAALMDLRPVRYRWKASGEEASGFLAQEVYEVFPEAVTPGDGTNVAPDNPAFRGWAMDPSKFMPLAVAMLQQHQRTIEALTARLDAAGL